jgi:hypothetical protein
LIRKGTLTFQTGDPANPTASVGLTASISNSVYSAGWPKWHQNNANTGQTEADTSWLTGAVNWKFQVDTASTYSHINSPVVDGSGNVYQVAMSGTFYALSPAGTQLWTAALSTPTGDPHPSTPAILASGSMYVASGSDGSPPNLYLIASTGSILSSISYGEDGFDASPGLGNDGTLYLADDDSSTGSTADPYTAVTFTTTGTTITQSAGIYLPYALQSERFGVVIADDGSSFWGNSGQFFAVTPPPLDSRWSQRGPLPA